MKVLFLDIDGVLCGPKEWDMKWKPELMNSYPFNRKAVKILNEILSTTGAEIILSSDWRRHHDLFELNIIFDMNCVVKSPLDVIPILPSISYGWGGRSSLEHDRTREINLFLKNHPEITKWVAIDDLILDVDNFIRCPKEDEGIKQTGIKGKIIKFLED
jgi:hypothetical protein